MYHVIYHKQVVFCRFKKRLQWAHVRVVMNHFKNICYVLQWWNIHVRILEMLLIHASSWHILKKYVLYFVDFFSSDKSTIDTMYCVTLYVLAIVAWVGLVHIFQPPYWMTEWKCKVNDHTVKYIKEFVILVHVYMYLQYQMAS